jgi:hypothetical protein
VRWPPLEEEKSAAAAAAAAGEGKGLSGQILSWQACSHSILPLSSSPGRLTSTHKEARDLGRDKSHCMPTPATQGDSRWLSAWGKEGGKEEG